MINIIIGKTSNLSKQLESKLHNTILVSSKMIVEELNKIDFTKYKNINIIFNQFQMASKLQLLDNPVDYINRSILSTAEVLEYVIDNNISINKIIYTSSSSVYGNNTSCLEINIPHPISLHASLKLANEKLIEKFCIDNNINYTITRLFNMYGGDDNFSIVSKIINCHKNNTTLTLINDGEAIRDFIYIEDVVYSYIKLLKVSELPIINIGTSDGKSLLYILNYLRKNNINIKTKNLKNDELKISISENKKLLEVIGNYSFKKVEDYILMTIKASNE